MRLRLLMLFVALFMGIIAGCEKTPNINTQNSKLKKEVGKGVLTGLVRRSPINPVMTEGMPSTSDPAPDVKLIILTPKRKKIASVTTDAKGEYKINLPLGTYRIETTSLVGIEFTKDLPTIVNITEGQETHLDINIDTGMR